MMTVMSMSITLCAAVIFYLIMNSASQFLPQSPISYPQVAGQMPMQMGSHMPMPYPLQMVPQTRLPVMMMPFHSKALDKKHRTHKRRKERYLVSASSSTSDSDESSSSEYYRRLSHKRGKRKRQVLTPVISYVTKNGRVVYQKKIKKENVGDWLGLGHRKDPETDQDKYSSQEMTVRDLKQKYGLRQKHSHGHEH